MNCDFVYSFNILLFISNPKKTSNNYSKIDIINDLLNESNNL